MSMVFPAFAGELCITWRKNCCSGFWWLWIGKAFKKKLNVPCSYSLWKDYFDDGDKQVVDKVKMQMDSFLEDGSHEATIAVVRALSVAIPLTTPSLRDYIL